jgi:hypothetical protein
MTSEKTITPSILAVRMNETEYWVKDFLQKYQIKEVWAVYIYDQNHVVNCCELEPSYELNFVEYQFVYEDGVEHSDETLEEIDEERYRSQANDERFSYYHCRVINKIPYRRRKQWNRERLHILTQADCREWSLDHEEAIDKAMEHCLGNQV